MIISRDVEFAEDLNTNPKIAAESQINLLPLDHKPEENRRFVEAEYNLSPEEEKIERTDDQEEDFRGFDRNPLDNEVENVADEEISVIETKRKPGQPKGRRSTTALENKNPRIGIRTGLRSSTLQEKNLPSVPEEDEPIEDEEFTFMSEISMKKAMTGSDAQ